MPDINRLLQCPPQSFFLLGPRGTGKSTWLRHVLPQAKVFNLLDESLFQACLADPGRFADELRPLAPDSWVVVDEVQRLPSLLNEVHRLIEERHLRFALCGSSARKLRRGGVNLLAGRALRRTMHPFMPVELGERYDVEAVLRYGSLPLVWANSEPREVLLAYAQMYLKEEIQAEALVRSLPGFARFLPVAAVCHGQTVNVSNLARDTGAARTTVVGYLDILEETLLAFRLPAYEARLRVRERRHPKLYWADPGLVRAVKKQLGEVTVEERGALFEGLVAGLLRAHQDYGGLYDELGYWASPGGGEVDFLLCRGGKIIAVEAKAGARFTDDWARGLRTIGALPGLVRRVIVCPAGPSLQTRDGIDVLPFLEFAGQVSAGRLWP